MKTKTIPEIIQAHSERLGLFHHGTDEDKINHILEDYHNSAVNALACAKAFRDDLLTYLRAIVLVLDMVGSASTHSEKNARLRGCVEVLDSAIGKIRDYRFDLGLNFRAFSTDLFRSDYPTRHFLDRIRELEAQVKSNQPERDLREALQDFVAVVERDLGNPEVAQPEIRRAKDLIASVADHVCAGDPPF